MDRDWMAQHVDPFASFFLQRYEKTGSLRESLMFAYVKTFDGEDPCVRCYNCGSMNRLNGQLVHASNCYVKKSSPQIVESK